MCFYFRGSPKVPCNSKPFKGETPLEKSSKEDDCVPNSPGAFYPKETPLKSQTALLKSGKEPPLWPRFKRTTWNLCQSRGLVTPGTLVVKFFNSLFKSGERPLGTPKFPRESTTLEFKPNPRGPSGPPRNSLVKILKPSLFKSWKKTFLNQGSRETSLFCTIPGAWTPGILWNLNSF